MYVRYKYTVQIFAHLLSTCCKLVCPQDRSTTARTSVSLSGLILNIKPLFKPLDDHELFTDSPFWSTEEEEEDEVEQQYSLMAENDEEALVSQQERNEISDINLISEASVMSRRQLAERSMEAD